MADFLDDQDRLQLDRLAPDARRILVLAHALAQERGQPEISHRLLLSALLTAPMGVTATRVREHGLAGTEMAAMLIASAGPENPQPLVLSAAACARAVLPMLLRAHALAASTAALDESLLFQAFCQLAPAQLKMELRLFPWPQRVDLEVFADPDLPPPQFQSWRPQLADELWETLLQASRLARLQGHAQVRSPHLAAALLRTNWPPLLCALEEQGVDVDQARRKLLETLPIVQNLAASVPVSAVRLGSNAQSALYAALSRASAGSPGRAVNRDLLAVLLADPDSITGVVLRKVGAELPLELDENG